MPEKEAPNDKKYTIDGKTFTWTTTTVDGEPASVSLPLRVKVKVLRTLWEKDRGGDVIMEMLESIAPTQADVLDELDFNDLMAMYSAWQDEYTNLTGATLGE